ncbi:hypothetical protein [Dapis sp. BLCC M229]
MSLKNQSRQKSGEAKSLAKLAQEFPPTPLAIISGIVPSGLRSFDISRS